MSESTPVLKPRQVYFFSTCVVDLMAPQAGMDAVLLIRAAGIEVVFPPAQSCCGQPAYTSGTPKRRGVWRRPSLACSTSPGQSSCLRVRVPA
jgi:L-lactate dehydrogenase complex protein LldE